MTNSNKPKKTPQSSEGSFSIIVEGRRYLWTGLITINYIERRNASQLVPKQHLLLHAPCKCHVRVTTLFNRHCGWVHPIHAPLIAEELHEKICWYAFAETKWNPDSNLGVLALYSDSAFYEYSDDAT